MPALPLSRLSLSARLSIALHVFEQYCRAKGLQHPLLTEFVDYLWDLPLVNSVEAYRAWCARDILLWDVALDNDTYSPEFEGALQAHSLDPAMFRALLENLVEVVYSGLDGTPDHAQSLEALQVVLRTVRRDGIEPPNLAPFQHSRFADAYGWGTPVTREERDKWRQLAALSSA